MSQPLIQPRAFHLFTTLDTTTTVPICAPVLSHVCCIVSTLPVVEQTDALNPIIISWSNFGSSPYRLQDLPIQWTWLVSSRHYIRLPMKNLITRTLHLSVWGLHLTGLGAYRTEARD
jgi:hypothetical protein